jgi:hypothetical protein
VPRNPLPDTSAMASASSPSVTGTLLRTNSMALSLSDSYARKFRTIRGRPSESKVVTLMFHPAGILGTALCAATVVDQRPALFKLTHYLRESGAYCVAGEEPRTLAIPRAPNQGCPVGWVGHGAYCSRPAGPTMTAWVAILRKIEGNTARSCNRAGAHCAKPLGVPPP